MQNEKTLNTAVIRDIDSKLRECLDTLINIQDKIKEILLPMADGKQLRGNDIVGLLGEIYAVKMLSGKLLPDGKETDIDVPDCKMRVSVKARKETSDKNNWKQTSDIHKIKDSDCTHLMFIKFDKEYRVANVWLYPWEVVEKRAEKHNSRGTMMGYIFRVNPKEDEKYLRYTDGKQKFENKSEGKEKHREYQQMDRSHSKPIEYVPSDLELFKNRLLQTRQAQIEITYDDGREDVKLWKAYKFKDTSDVRNNLRSREEFRQGNWQKNRIKKVVVRIPNND